MLRMTLIVLLLAAPATADVRQGQKVIECFCTDRTGARVELGETVCMQVDGRMFMARCEMSLNNPMWREVQNGCMTSQQNMTPIPDHLSPAG